MFSPPQVNRTLKGNSMKPYKCLIVGLGDIGLKYDLGLSKRFVYTHARAISIHPDFELIGAVDINKKNRDEFKKNYRKPVFTNFNLSLIHISEPTRHLRISYAVFCLKKKTNPR